MKARRLYKNCARHRVLTRLANRGPTQKGDFDQLMDEAGVSEIHRRHVLSNLRRTGYVKECLMLTSEGLAALNAAGWELERDE